MQNNAKTALILRMNYSVTLKTIDSAINATKLFELKMQSALSIMDGKYRAARASQKAFAKLAVDDFDSFKALPNIKITGIPLKEGIKIFFKNLGFKIFKLFTRRTPEEKQLATKYKAYRRELTPEDIKNHTIDFNLPSLY